MSAHKSVAVLISGRGTNMRALVEATQAPGFPARIAVVIANKPEAEGLDYARSQGIATEVIPSKGKTREAFDAELDAALKQHGVEIVCLAGFMRLLTPEFVQGWFGRMLNIHPSLLPAFKGIDVHRRVIESGTRFTGCTVHFVVPEMDDGPIVIQAAIPVPQDATPEMLADAILVQEHAIYPQALRWLADGKLLIEGNRVRIDGAGMAQDAMISPPKEQYSGKQHNSPPEALRDARKIILEATSASLKTGMGIFEVDFLFVGAANRSLALIDGFIQLHQTKNFLCMAPVLRMHLDTLLRLHAANISSDANALAIAVMRGEQINQLRDKDGQAMTDGHLRRTLVAFWAERGRNIEWIHSVYKKTSGHIHLSGAHIFSTAKAEEEFGTSRTISFGVSGLLHQEESYTDLANECFEAMLEVSGGIAAYLQQWARTKTHLANEVSTGS